jgi:hypothetical protein
MISSLITIGSSKQTLILISIIVVVTIVDSQLINIFYGTDLDTPGDLHMLLFVALLIIASIISTTILLFVKRNDIHARTTRPSLFKAAYVGTSAVQYSILLILLIILSEMLIFHAYNKIFSLLIMYFSHIWSAIILGVLSFIFIQWFRYTRSFSILIYAVVFSVVLFLILITIPLLTQQFANQPGFIYPRDYTILIESVNIPSRDIAFIYGLGNFVLPLMIIASWILTVSLIKPYAGRIGKKTFWVIVSIPLLYQLFSFIIRDANIVTDPALVEIIYSKQFQFIFGISYQITGLFFAIAFLTLARKMKRKSMRNYLLISSLGLVSLFSSMQPGMPFYAAYPPFGLVTLSFLGVSSYMLLVGIVGFAANVSRNTEVRQEVYKSIERDSHVLRMGMAEMQKEIEMRVLAVVDKIKLTDQPRDRDKDPDDEDVKMMIDEVLKEVHSKKSDATR